MGRKLQSKAPVDRKVITLQLDATFFFERAVRFLNRYRYDKAIKYFRLAVDYEPENPVNHCNLAGVLSEVGNYQESNQILRKIVEEVDPSMTECWFYMANNYANMEKFEEAEQAIIQYLENDPEGQFLQESQEMMELLELELERPSEPVSIKCREGLIEHERARRWLEEGRFSEAAHMMKKLVRKYPDFLAARNNLALAYYYMGQFAQAMDAVREVLEIDPGNLHALCNLAIFYQHIGETGRLADLTRQLCKTYPYYPEHAFKLAATMGVLGEHERAYFWFRRLIRAGYCEPCLYHYMAVACCHLNRPNEARRYWDHAAKLDPESPVPTFYLNLLEKDTVHPDSLSYHYHLPFEELLREIDLEKGELPETLKNDPLLRSSFFWALRYGNFEVKLQAIQVLGNIGDQEVKAVLSDFLMQRGESDYLKKVAVFVLRSMGVKEPLTVCFGNKQIVLPPSPYAPGLPEWDPQWQQVLELAFHTMDDRYGLVQKHDLETLWTEYLSRIYPQKPRMTRPEGWAAALEYWTAKMHKKPLSYDAVASLYNTTVSTVRTCVKHIDTACGLKQKMDELFTEWDDHSLDDFV